MKTLPSVREAIELKDWKQAEKEILTTGKLIEAYAAEIDKATLILKQAMF